MTIQEAIKKYSKIEIELLLAHVLKKPKEFIFMHPEHKLTARQIAHIAQTVKRRLKGEPIAYILGYKDFYGLRFMVNRSVLIPRPETEWIVEKTIEGFKDLKFKDSKTIKILDLGTGSGAIAITLARQFKIFNLKFKIIASDVSAKALSVAKVNAILHHSRIKFIKSDLFNHHSGKFDIIVANLPYVPRKIYNLKFKNLKFEPKIALVGPKKDFDIYERFLRQAGEHIFSHSTILLEIDPRAKSPISKWVKKYLPGWQVKFYKDYNKLWRYAEIYAVA